MITRRVAPATLVVPGDTVVVFGPKRAATPTGALATTVEVFGVPAADAGRRYLLKVENGASNGSARVTGGGVLLTGAAIVTSAELGAIPVGGALYKPVVLQPQQNALVAAVRGPAGAYVTLSVMTAPDPTFTVWGPTTYERAKGTPVTRTDHFTRPAGGGAPYYLHVLNGAGARRSAAVSVKLNGVEVVGPLEVNLLIAGVVTPVTLQPENVLEVKLLGAPGSRLTLRLAATDALAPVLALTAPAVGLVTTEAQLAVGGTVTDQTPPQVTANGVVATLQGSNNGASGFTATVPLGAEGPHTITVRATDAAGHTTDSVRTVIRDTEAPVVRVTSLPDSATVSADSVAVVQGTITDRTRVTANLNGTPVAIDSATGAFSQRIVLTAGVNFLTLTATDAAGNATTVARQVTREAAPPTLTVTAPADRQITTAPTVRVTGTATAATPPAVTVNGTAVVLGPGGSFGTDVALVEGSTAIRVIATSAAGPSATVTRTVLRDTQAPAIALTGPADGLVTREGTLLVSGTATDATALTLTLNGSPLAVAPGTGGFTTTLPLAEGPATLTFVATDAAGNVTTMTRTVVRDATPPAITLQNPAPGAMSRTAAYRVAGSVSDATAVTVTVNGAPAAVAGDGSVSADVTLMEGPNAISVVARDAAGNETTATGSVRLDAAPPLLAVATPSDGLATKTATLVVTGTAADQTGVTVTVNGVPATMDGTGAFSAEVALAEGANSVTVLATDGAGNTVSAVREVTLDTQAPALSVDAPADGLRTSEGSVTVSGTVSDAAAVSVTVNGVPALVSGTAFSQRVSLNEGANTITVLATDAVGNSVTVTRSVTRTSGPASQPSAFTEQLGIDASVNAPTLDPTVIRPLTASLDFLYTGANAPQRGVAPGTIRRDQAGVLRGRVLDRAGAALEGVTVRVLGHPEYGTVLSRANGLYELVVNAGGVTTLEFKRDGLLPAQRTVETGQQDFTIVPELAMVAPDSAATVVTFTAPIEVARGSLVTDRNGSRQATLLFAQGTTATVSQADGTQRTLSTLTVRATEYTVGANGRTAMPAQLPPTSEYTYAVELSADEVDLAATEEIIFSRPVGFYLENFRGFPVGTAVPMGYYDRRRGVWVPQPNGRVVRVLSIEGGVAVLDVTGDSAPATQEALDSLGVTAQERAQVGQLYNAGQTLWRTPIAHFSTWDGNMGQGPGPRKPNRKPPKKKKMKGKPCVLLGSAIECENQVLGERAPIAGTGLSLAYRTDRVPGRGQSMVLEIPAIGNVVPPSLAGIDVVVNVAGRSFIKRLLPDPNQDVTFVWDGLDAFGRRVPGATPYSVLVKYLYPIEYGAPAIRVAAFGLRCVGRGPEGSITSCTLPSLPDKENLLSTTETYGGTLGSWTAAAEQGQGGWTLEPHHVYDPVSKTLYLGNGSRLTDRDVVKPDRRVISGGGSAVSADTMDLDGLPARSVKHGTPAAVAVTPAGEVIFADSIHNVVWKVGRSGIITRLAGLSSADAVAGPTARSTRLNHPRGIALAPDGSVYIADSDNHRVLRVRPDSTVELVAGNGTDEVSGDGALAVDAGIGVPARLALTPDGALYVLDVLHGRVRVVMPDGRIASVAGGGAQSTCRDDDILATESCLSLPTAIAATADGTVYIAEEFRIRAVDNSGVIRTLAGSGSACSSAAFEGKATETGVCATGLAAAPDGALYVTDNMFLRRIDPDGHMTTVHSCGAGLFQSSSLPIPLLEVASTLRGRLSAEEVSALARYTARRAEEPLACMAVAIGPDHAVYVSEVPDVIVRLAIPNPGYTAADFVIASPDGGIFYEFDVNVRHIATRSTANGRPLTRFTYDANGRVASMTDRLNQTVTIERAANGRATQIRAPFGQITRLGYDPNGWLGSLSYPDGGTASMSYTDGGLLAQLVTPMMERTTFTYDTLGALLRENGELGWQQSIEVAIDSAGRTAATVTAANGRTSVHRSEDDRDGAQTARTATSPGGGQTTTTTGIDGTTNVQLADGTSLQLVPQSDTLFGAQVSRLKSASISIPGMNDISTRSSHHVELAHAEDPRSIRKSIDSVWVNDRLTAETYDVTTGLAVRIHPEGTVDSTNVDSLGRVTRVKKSGLTPMTFTYDAAGRPASAERGDRRATLAYGVDGLLSATTDALNQRTQFDRDAMGRISSRLGPDGQRTSTTYDLAGRLTRLQGPGGGAYQFHRDIRGRLTSIVAPSTAMGPAVTSFDYDATRLLGWTRPDGTRIAVTYDSIGGPLQLSGVGLTQRFTHDPVTGMLLSATSAEGDTITYGHAAKILTDITWRGRAAGSVRLQYTSDLRVRSVTVNDASSVYNVYDDAGRLAYAGDLNISYDAATGLGTSAIIGSMATTWTRDSLGQVTRTEHAYAGTSLLTRDLAFDKLGRIARASEAGSVDAAGHADTVTTSYDYDAIGQLTRIVQGGTPLASYDYDANGNRVRETSAAGTVTSSYSARDELLTRGDVVYTYTPNGERATRTAGGAVTRYGYDPLGRLTTVSLPTGQAVRYEYDPSGRRIGRRVDGVLTQRLLYQSQVAPAAALDAAGTILAQYVYGTHPNVPDYMITADGERYRFVLDEIGSVRLVVQVSTGDVVQRITYDAWGRTTANSNPGFQPFGYGGGLADDATALVHLGFREYDPETGRWISADPIGLKSGVTNLATYVGNNPVNNADPTGLCPRGYTCDNMVSAEEGLKILQAAIESGEWTYSQQPYGGSPYDPSVALPDETLGDCTQFVREAVDNALGTDWEAADYAKAGTADFRAGVAPGFVEVPQHMAQPGDVVVRGGHAGIFIGIDAQKRVWGCANNGSPHRSKTSGYKDSDTGLTDFSAQGKVDADGNEIVPRFFRPLVP